MKKLKTTILVFLISITINNHAGNAFPVRSTSNDIFSFAENNPANPTAIKHYSPADLGMSAASLARIDLVVKEGMDAKHFPDVRYWF